jgi:hypothetical protein
MISIRAGFVPGYRMIWGMVVKKCASPVRLGKTHFEAGLSLRRRALKGKGEPPTGGRHERNHFAAHSRADR